MARKLGVILGLSLAICLSLAVIFVTRSSTRDKRVDKGPQVESAPIPKGLKQQAPNPKVEKDDVALTLLSIPLGDLTAREGGDMNDKLRRDELKTALQKSSGASSLAEGTKGLEEYVRKYPLSPDTAVVMNVMGINYARMGKFGDSRRVLEDAIKLAGNDRFANTMKINLAYLSMKMGDYKAAKAQLKGIMKQPVPDSWDDPYSISPQVFTAPIFYSRVLVEENSYLEAETMLEEISSNIYEMAKEHPGVEWIESCVAGAYSERVKINLTRTPPNFKKARSICEEFNKKMPKYRGLCSYGAMLMSIQMFENSAKDETK